MRIILDSPIQKPKSTYTFYFTKQNKTILNKFTYLHKL